MPLIPPDLANKYESAWKAKSPAEAIVAQKEAKAMSSYVDTGLTAMGGVPTSTPGMPGLASNLESLWKSHAPNEDIVGKQESLAIHNLIMATMTSGGKHGVGGFMSGTPSALGNDLASFYKSHQPNETLAALKKAKIVDSYLKSITWRGSGTPPDFVPDISSLS